MNKKNPKKLSKKEIQNQIKDVFLNNPSPREIKKTKQLAMSKNIKLGSLKKKFCKKCFTLFDSSNYSIKIKKPLKIIICKNCGYVSRFKMK